MPNKTLITGALLKMNIIFGLFFRIPQENRRNMKKLLIPMFCLLPGLLFAQYNYMALSFGVSMPNGEFAGNSDLAKHGFAKQGFSGEYTGAYFLTDYFGIGENIKFSSNDVDRNALADLLTERIPDSIADLNPTLSIGVWRQIALMAGPHLSLPLASELYVDAYALGGFNFVLPPDMELTASVDGEGFYRTLSVQSLSFALDLGLALRYNFNEMYGLRIYSSYFLSKAKGEVIEELQDRTGLNTETSDFTTPIRSLHAGIGLVYRL